MRRIPGASLAVCLALLGGCSDPEPPTAGFAGLGQALEQNADDAAFSQPGPGDRIRLPADLGAHPDYRIEWWYLTANLTTADGQPLGLQWTQFRQSLRPRDPDAPAPAPGQWPLDAVWMAHAAISRPGDHHFAERLARGDIGHAGARAQPFAVWLDDWELHASPGAGNWRLSVSADDWGYDLTLTPRRALVRHGNQGFSAKSSSGEGSLYFSYVDLAIEGTVTLAGRTIAVQGSGWFDREWSSRFLRADQRGWDWMALQLESGARVMVFRLREEGGHFLSGSWIGAGGDVKSLSADDFSLTVEATREAPEGEVPSRWRLQIPRQAVDLEITAMTGDFWNHGLYPYWESPVFVSGSDQGRGYLELTGYGNPAP